MRMRCLYAINLTLVLLGSVSAAEQRSITGAAQIRLDDNWTWLEATDGTSSFKTSWVHPPVQLEAGSTYTFIVEFHDFTEPWVEKILQGQKLIYDSSVCELHQVRMHRDEIPMDIGSGGPRPYRLAPKEQPSFEIRMSEFPHYIEIAYGGCVDWGERTAMIYRCDQCRAAFIHWRGQHASHQ